MRCEQCHAEKLVAFSCKNRGCCPSCGARLMAEAAALLADAILLERLLRRWVLSLPMTLRFLVAINLEALMSVLGVLYRTISGSIIAIQAQFECVPFIWGLASLFIGIATSLLTLKYLSRRGSGMILSLERGRRFLGYRLLRRPRARARRHV